jgi:NAD(P)-dependent dehydrogenase (short-subunit alcohol dehydrogenase family)
MKPAARRSAYALAAIAAATAAAAAIRRPRQPMKLTGKVVLITGGSHGLGLALAREFAKEGSHLVICARSEAELERARADLNSFSVHDVLTVACDVSVSSQVDNLVALTISRYGRIDVLVNNAGIIHVGPIDTMTLEDFRTAMDVMFWGTVYTTFAALPYMRGQEQARVVNITSVGAKVAVPHLLPYSCAKFACAAFSEGMRSELHGTGVKVVTIAPGLMRTGSHLNAVFRGAEEGEAVWFSLGASLPVLSMSAEKAARQIVSATALGTAERILGSPAKLLAGLNGLFPGVTAEILGLVSRALPHGSRRTERGGDSPILKTFWMRALTALGRQAAHRLLQPDARN